MPNWLKASNRWTWTASALLGILLVAIVWRAANHWATVSAIRSATNSTTPRLALAKLDRIRSLNPSDPKIHGPLIAAYNAYAIRLDNDGDPATATEFFSRALEMAPAHPQLLQNFLVALNNSAVEHSTNRQFERSQTRFEQAMALLQSLPDGPLHDQTRANYSALLTIWSQELLRKAKDAAARDALEQAVSLHTTNTLAWVALGDLAYEADDFAEALRAYETAGSIDPQTRSTLQPRIEILHGELSLAGSLTTLVPMAAGFRVALPEHGAVAAKVLPPVLESARRHVEGQTGLKLLRPVSVRVFSAQDFHRVSNLPEWAVGSYDGKIRLKLEDAEGPRDQLENLLAHEIAHAVLAAHLPADTPPWFHEAVAQVLEPRQDMSPRVFLVRAAKLRRALREDAQTLEGGRAFHHYADRGDADTAYFMSRNFLLHLLNQDNGKDLVGVLATLAGAETFDAGFRAVFGQTVAERENAWRREILEGARGLSVPVERNIGTQPAR